MANVLSVDHADMIPCLLTVRAAMKYVPGASAPKRDNGSSLKPSAAGVKVVSEMIDGY